MAVIEKRETQDGKTHYRVKVRLKGYPPQTSTHERLADAKRWAADTEASIRQGRHFKTAEAKKHTLGELIDRYIRDVLPQKKKSQKKQTAQSPTMTLLALTKGFKKTSLLSPSMG